MADQPLPPAAPALTIGAPAKAKTLGLVADEVMSARPKRLASRKPIENRAATLRAARSQRKR